MSAARAWRAAVALAGVAILWGCGPSPRSLGFESEEQMQDAFRAGYLTGQRMAESRKPAAMPDYSAFKLESQPGAPKYVPASPEQLLEIMKRGRDTGTQPIVPSEGPAS